ncbi:MAG: FAD-dependent oxidoreductase [Acidimicrobiales bacterium]
MGELDLEGVDLLIVGGGMAGLAAGASAAQRGGRVVLVERAAELGGSAAYAGFIWTAPSIEVLHEVNPEGDPELAAKYVNDFEPSVEWVRSLSVDCLPAVTLLGYGSGHQTDMNNLLRTCESIIEGAPRCAIYRSTNTTELIVEHGAVLGALVESDDGRTGTIHARHTLLASGGFQGDPLLRSLLISPRALDIPLRSNPYSRGDGLRLGISAGAAFGMANAGFYGHLVPYGVPLTDPTRFVVMSLYYSEHGLLVNARGERFVDETLGDHLNTMAVLDQPAAHALLIADERVRQDWMLASYVKGVEGVDRYDLVRRRGGRCAIAHDIEELLYIPDEWGYDNQAVHDTVIEYNRQCAEGTPTPERRFDTMPLDKPPYYVVDTGPAITFTFSGMMIDAKSRVLDGDGQPIPGLLSAGADAGGLYYRSYAGGLAYALVFGRQAAATAMGEG